MLNLLPQISGNLRGLGSFFDGLVFILSICTKTAVFTRLFHGRLKRFLRLCVPKEGECFAPPPAEALRPVPQVFIEKHSFLFKCSEKYRLRLYRRLILTSNKVKNDENQKNDQIDF